MSEEEEVFDVEAIIDHRIMDGRIQYLIRWRTFGDEEASWEFEDDMNCPEMIDDYKNNLALKESRFAEIRGDKLTGAEAVKLKRPKMVIGAFKDNEKLFYRVACAKDRFYTVEADVLRQIAPELICMFLESRIKVKKPGANSEQV